MEKLRKLTLVSLFLLFVLFLRAVPVWAQAVANAQIAGIISDPSGAAVPNAHITATQTNTHFVRTTVSGSDGTYVLAELPIGPYELEVRVSGFKTYQQTGIELQVDSKVQVNVSLEVGALSQSVQVKANADMVQVQQTAVSTVVDQRRMVDLPLNGRDATALVLLAGASAAVTSGMPTQFDLNAVGGVGKTWPTEVPMSLAGGQLNGTFWMLDGADNVDAFMNVTLPYPFPDALQEFNVETSATSARFGAHPGGAVNVVTKSGTNKFHGDAFEFLRNGDLNARNYFATKQDTLKRNQFGGTIGGPIIKDKVFFFGGYQGTRNRTSPPTSVFHVPTQAVLNGDFSALESAACQSSGTAATLTNPATGEPFANNFINPSLFNSSALGILKYVPVSTDPCGKVLVGIPATGDENQYVPRVDWILSQKHSIFARYFYTGWSNPSEWDGKDILPAQRTGLLDRSQAWVLGDTYALNATTVNSLHLAVTRLRIDRGAPANYIGPQDFGIAVHNPIPNILSLTVSGFFKAGGPGPTLSEIVNTFPVADDVDMIRGRHHLAFGGEYTRRQMNEYNISCGNGVFGFNGSLTGNALADFMLGDPSSFLQCDFDRQNPRQTILGLYATDVIHVNSHFTLSAGLRWEPFLPVKDRFGRGSHFDLAAFNAGTISSQYVNAPAGTLFYGDPGIPSTAYTNNRVLQIGPHVGLAWDPTGKGKQSIRASFSLEYNDPFLYYNQIAEDAPPWGAVIGFPDPVGGLSNPWEGYAGGDPFPLPFPPAKTAPFPLDSQYETIGLNIHPEYMEQWNLSYQRQIRTNWLLSATYIGNHTVHLWLSGEMNQPVYIPGNCVAGQYGLTAPGPCSSYANDEQRRILAVENPTWGPYYGTLDYPEDGFNDEYNALLLSAQHRFSDNFTVLSNYTWSHCLGNGDDQGELEPSSFQNALDPQADRGNCLSDHRQIFNTSAVLASPTFGQQWKQRFLGNWRFSPIISVSSGLWFNALTGLDNSLTSNGNDRPNQVLTNPYASSPACPSAPCRQWLNPAAFVVNPLGTFGDAGRDALVGPGSVEFDMALSRLFPLGEARSLEFRFEAFNVINHANFAVPDNTQTDSTFGQIIGAADPRILQFALKFYF
jgi:hypothetical protein